MGNPWDELSPTSTPDLPELVVEDADGFDDILMVHPAADDDGPDAIDVLLNAAFDAGSADAAVPLRWLTSWTACRLWAFPVPLRFPSSPPPGRTGRHRRVGFW